MRGFFLGAICLATVCTPFQTDAAETVRIGALKFGTLNWELSAITSNALDVQNNVTLEVTYFAGEDASHIAFQAGEVDVIVTDWLEVGRLRGQGQDVTFVPYSSSTGAIMVAAGSPIHDLADIRGKTLAVAGGHLDKNWLLLQGMAAQEGFDLVKENEIVYGAPPLIAEKLRAGEFDAALNYWQFNARLEADGFRQIASGEDAAKALGATGTMSTLGYVFHGKWAAEHPGAIRGFQQAARAAKAVLQSSDAEWSRLQANGLIKASDTALAFLRDRYRDGIPRRTVEEEEQDATRLFPILARLGGGKLTGSASELPSGTYWRAPGNAD